MINPIKRVPKELEQISNDVQRIIKEREGVEITKIKSFEIITEFAKPEFWRWRQKKGQILDFLSIIMFVIIVALFFSIFLYGLS